MRTARKRNKQNKDDAFFARWKRQIQYAWQNVINDIRQHIFASFLTTIVIAISITLPTIGYLLWKNANQAANQWYPSPNLTVYLNKSLDKAHTDELLTQIKRLPAVREINYISTAEALAEFKAWSGLNEAIDLLEDNPLPAVAIVLPYDNNKTESLRNIKSTVIKMNGVDDAKLDDSWFTRLTALTNLIKIIVVTLSIFMMIAVALVIGNSIRLAIFARRQTLTVMQLIGATEGFILRPFLYNGLFNGFMSAVLALILAEVFILLIDSVILNVSSIFGTIFTIEGLTMSEAILVILITSMIGWFSALISTKKYLKIKQLS